LGTPLSRQLRCPSGIEDPQQTAILVRMSSDVQEIEQAIRSLPRPEVEQLRKWIENFLEDQLELTDEFEASIERGKSAIAEGNLRVRESF
jgi:hypothetical protein